MSSRSTELRRAREIAIEALLAECHPAGHWEGRLSSSALSTATAITALAVCARESGHESSRHRALMEGGTRWLVEHVNEDGGWGDTDVSFSNLSTTALVWAALGAVPRTAEQFASTIAAAEQWLARRIGGGGLEPERLARALAARYGKDRTFSVPILTMCALAGRLGPEPGAWRHVPPLPFELAAVPRGWFATLRLPVVSYALPALIAIGQVRQRRLPVRGPLGWLRSATERRTLKVLEGIQPANGGFLEATPLTSFVTMSLAGCGLSEHPVTRRGLAFLDASVREDGSWPIDTNLATWVTTLAVNALGTAGLRRLPEAQCDHLRQWLLGQQYRGVHPYTNAPPGGWAWTNLPGGVPDADDTAGALLALRVLDDGSPELRRAGESGMRWLLDLQNRDGGVPTFCRGWTNLPFDRSGADLTAHALRAWAAWRDAVSPPLQRRLERARHRALAFLKSNQRGDGAWLPLWFGNQHLPDETNPTYGTAKVLRALADPWVRGRSEAAAGMAGSGLRWLASAMNPDGSWGGGSRSRPSIEETALAMEALTAWRQGNLGDTAVQEALRKGREWLRRQILDGRWTRPAPIGFYFARLWYYERLYPIIAATGATNGP